MHRRTRIHSRVDSCTSVEPRINSSIEPRIHSGVETSIRSSVETGIRSCVETSIRSSIETSIRPACVNRSDAPINMRSRVARFSGTRTVNA